MPAPARKWVAILCIAAILCLAFAPIDWGLPAAILPPAWFFLGLIALLLLPLIDSQQRCSIEAIIPVLAQRPPPAA